MSTTAIVLIIVAAVVVLAIVAWAATRARGRKLEERRQEAQEVRMEAQTTGRRAERARLAAEEQAERARKEQLHAAELHDKANELDPDVEDADAATARGSEDTEATTTSDEEWVRVQRPS
jgi:biopolymer transport protein ExbB/TolQ